MKEETTTYAGFDNNFKQLSTVLNYNNQTTTMNVSKEDEGGYMFIRNELDKQADVNVATGTASERDTSDLLIAINSAKTTEFLPLVSALVLLMTVGLVGNALVVYVYKRKFQESAKGSFILTLAILDLIVCVIVIPFEIFDIVNQVTFTFVGLCKTMRVLEYVTVLSAGFVLVAVSFERYHFICKAFTEFSPRKANIICGVCVLMAVSLSFPAGIIASSKERTIYHGNITLVGHECSMRTENKSGQDKTAAKLKQIYYYSLSFVFLACFFVFIVLYSIIGRLLWKYQKGTLVQGLLRPSSESDGNTRPKKISVDSHTTSICSVAADSQVHGRKGVKSVRSIIVFFSVTVVFVVSFLPHIVMRILGFLNIDINSPLLYNCVIRSFLVSNVSNPFIYSIFNTSFRIELKKAFRRMNDAFIPTRLTVRRRPKTPSRQNQPRHT